MSIPILDLSDVGDPAKKPDLLRQLHDALFDVGFLYIRNHGVPPAIISALTDTLPALFDLKNEDKASLSKLNSPHFLGYSGFAEETTQGKKDLREQFDFATELPVVFQDPDILNSNPGPDSRDFSRPYWRLRGPNQWPPEQLLPGFHKAFTDYHDALQALSYRFLNLIEEAFEIPVGTFDHFFGRSDRTMKGTDGRQYLPPQHRIKLLRYPPAPPGVSAECQGVGAHRDSSGWLTFLYQVGSEPGLEVLSVAGEWIRALPIEGTFVVNFGNAFEAATEGAVKATTHRVVAPKPDGHVRYSIPFFQGLPLDMTVSEVRRFIPEHVRRLRPETESYDSASDFLDPRWDSLGESQLRKWIRSHPDVAAKWYQKSLIDYYTAQG